MFQSARLKLTAWYLAIIMAISIIFSTVIYHGITDEIRRSLRAEQIHIYRLEHPGFFLQAPIPVITFDQQLYELAAGRIKIILIVINIGIFLFAGGAGYFLAGRTLKPIKNMIDEQNRFITDASHELRTPITSLKSEIEVYMRGKNHSQRETDTLINSNLEEVNNLQKLTDNLLQLAQYQKINGHATFTNVSLFEALSLAEKKAHTAAKFKSIRVEIPPTVLCIPADKESLIQLFGIFMENAVKYSPAKSTVTINVEKTDHSAVIAISDQGIGIDKKDIPHIFDRFYRADSSRTKQTVQGYGLGLSIAKKIIDTHHGTIGIKSELGKGTTFKLILPYLKNQGEPKS